MSNTKQENEKQVSEKMNGVIIGGRKRKITKEELLEAVRKYKTESPSELATYLEVERTTIWRRLQEIPHEEIEAIFKELVDYELKPNEMVWEVFKELLEIKEYEMLLIRRQVSPEYKDSLLRGIYHLAKYFKKRPKSFNAEFIDKLGETLALIRDKKIIINGLRTEEQFRKTVRSWYIYHGISGEFLTAKDIGGELGKSYGKRATDKITMEQRIRVMDCLKTVLINEGLEKEIPKWNSLVYFLFYTGTRITATLGALIENIRWSSEDLENVQTIGTINVIDKGRHRKGRIEWKKLIAGALKMRILENLRSRTPTLDGGMIQNGLLFDGLTIDKVRIIFRKAYAMANIKVHQPAHIWRHTASQELLDATDWNYEIVASILGWKDTKTLKECYGRMGESIRERALKKAMGIPIQEEPKYFRLLPEDLPFPIKA